MNYLNDKTRLNAIMHRIFIFQNKNLEFRKNLIMFMNLNS